MGYPKWIMDAARSINGTTASDVMQFYVNEDAATIQRHYLASLGDDRIADAFAIFEEIRIKHGAEVVVEAVHSDPPLTHPPTKWLVWFNLPDGGSSRQLVGATLIECAEQAKKRFEESCNG